MLLLNWEHWGWQEISCVAQQRWQKTYLFPNSPTSKSSSLCQPAVWQELFPAFIHCNASARLVLVPGREQHPHHAMIISSLSLLPKNWRTDLRPAKSWRKAAGQTTPAQGTLLLQKDEALVHAKMLFFGLAAASQCKFQWLLVVSSDHYTSAWQLYQALSASLLRWAGVRPKRKAIK